MTSDATALDARLAQVEADMAKSDPRFVSEAVREIVTLGRAVLALVDTPDPQDCPTCRALIEATMRELDRPEVDPVAWHVKYPDAPAWIHHHMGAMAPEGTEGMEFRAVYASPVGRTQPEPTGYVVVHHDLLGKGQPIIPYPGTLYLTLEGAEKNAKLRRQADKNTGFNDDAYTVEPVGRTPVSEGEEPEDSWLYPPSTMKAVGTIKAGVGCTCPTAWKPPHDPKCPFHGRVSEASALRDIVEEMEQESPPGRSFVPGSIIREWARRLRALEDTKEAT